MTLSPLVLNGPVLYSTGLVLVLFIVRKLFFAKSKLPLPPGPKGIPIFGNIGDLPPPGVTEWEHWRSHKDLYGPISSVTVLGTTIILLHDAAITLELLEKRSSKTSSRPHQTFSSDLCGYGRLLAFQSDSESFRAQRRLIASQIGSRNSVKSFHSAIDVQSRRFLIRTINDNEELIYNLQAETASIMLDSLYGYTSASTGHDPLVDLVNKFMHQFGIASVAGAWLVDTMPWLRYLPGWVPGTGFKKTAHEYRKTMNDLIRIPREFTEGQMEKGTMRPSLVAALLQNNPNEQEQRYIESAASGLYGGAADTTVASLASFFVAMTVFPEIQEKAREEIDRVVGSGRLPGFQDRDSLPYIEACVSEVLRWQPIAPLSLPHATSDGDEIRGYLIPKGAIIVPVVAGHMRDPKVYQEPEAFRPERFLGPNPEPNPRSHVFGYGRRLCPGRHFADANIWLTVAQSLASLDIKKAVNKETGKIIEPELGLQPGVVAYPKSFRARISPRNEQYADLIQSVEIEHPWEEGDAKHLTGMD